MKKIYLLVYMLIMTKLSFGYLNLSPTSFDKNISNGGYQEFTLYNNTTIPVRYRIEPKKMDKKGVKDMSSWIEVYPKVVTVYPAEGKSFKVYVKSAKNSPVGDYGAFLNIKQISAPKLKNQKGPDVGAGMVVMVNLNLGIYGYVGDLNPIIETSKPIIRVSNKKQYLNLKINNKTNRLVKLEVTAKVGRNKFYKVKSGRIMANNSLSINDEIKNIPLNEKVNEIVITDLETNKVLKSIRL